ncbi:MAG TPA: septum formation initiator family protein [Gemmatimonas sp.]|uniref:FtsB family cell division protein n=1 Tax=Gemmatimonas sp. TaxID=1962908 RepID=UPI002EDAA7BD
MARSSASKGSAFSALWQTVWVRRLVWGAGILAVLAFAVEGGEYGSSDLFTQRDKRSDLENDLQDLRDSVAVLRAELKAVATDPARLERLAREEYGMVRGDKEILYRFNGARSDSVPAPQTDERSDESAGVDSGSSVANIPRLPRGGAAW